MKKILTLLGIGLVLLSVNSFAGNYTVDQNKIDAMFANATDITAIAAFDLGDLQALPMTSAQLDEKDPIIALALATVLGYLGIHRLYLGTNPINIVLYIITAGGCGVVYVVDWIMLLMVMIDDEKSLAPYIDNPKFIMWMDKTK